MNKKERFMKRRMKCCRRKGVNQKEPVEQAVSSCLASFHLANRISQSELISDAIMTQLPLKWALERCAGCPVGSRLMVEYEARFGLYLRPEKDIREVKRFNNSCRWHERVVTPLTPIHQLSVLGYPTC